MTDLHGKRVLLGVTGSIAAYKSPDIVRRLREQGADVRVVLTASAEKLVAPAVFQAVSGEPVRGDIWDAQAEAAMGHIELARWADIILIAPATANVIAQLANGAADNLLTTLVLASDAQLALAPAMNQAMWNDPATQENCAVLAGRNVLFIGPAEGSQACGDSGPGRMMEPVDIVSRLARGGADGALQGVRVVVTAGPTREPIDPVRFISNRSSGKMGFAVARAAAQAGADVLLIAGPVNLPTPPGVQRLNAETTQQMFDTTMANIADAHIYIGAAAIADYRPVAAATQKIKKQADTLDIHMTRSPDLLATIAALDDGPFAVGFAAETEKLEEHATAKLERKRLGMIIANLVG
ncbi:MAG: bifunctional phosphopantothenoylcysteine decarboxylase/phosphopantothenate--cysteine ligase CoaBC, partial [Gammaproteobacteria bacterium]|nr:bifunctional phosphopantothenoylcysteine decarboxylase/phosphopantothenate--cysteine ligase CoaBC [Gammaproteobacteria bacterium]